MLNEVILCKAPFISSPTVFESKQTKMLRIIILLTFAMLQPTFIQATPLPQADFHGHSIVVHYTNSPYKDVLIQGRKNFQD